MERDELLSRLADTEAAALAAKPEWKPDVRLPVNPRDFKTPNYGLITFADLFTPRQLVALTTFSDLIQEARERVQRDALDAGLVLNAVSPTSLRLAPPLNVTNEEIDEAVALLTTLIGARLAEVTP